MVITEERNCNIRICFVYMDDIVWGGGGGSTMEEHGERLDKVVKKYYR